MGALSLSLFEIPIDKVKYRLPPRRHHPDRQTLTRSEVRFKPFGITPSAAIALSLLSKDRLCCIEICHAICMCGSGLWCVKKRVGIVVEKASYI